jgi:hypothetical protein
MNLFILDESPRLAAQYHVNSHVVKMVTEAAQLLSTAHVVLDGQQVAMKMTNISHPCASWVSKSTSNYDWCYWYYLSLAQEYTYRYGKNHASFDSYYSALVRPPSNIKKGELTPFALAMPDQYKVPGDAVQSYRNYYTHGKVDLHTWKRRGKPEWMI